jgi:hypothetical protein
VDHLTPPVLRFGPDRRVTAGLGVGTAIALVLAFTAGDRPGRLLFGLAALVLAGYTLGDLVFWPRLTADPQGLLVRTPMQRTALAWADIEAVRADERLRFGLRSTTLEVDAGAVLVVFSRRALGADPAAVRDLLAALHR